MLLPFNQILIALSIGLIAGSASGLFGIGGGVIIVPFLMYFFNYIQQSATATSLVALVLPVGILGIIKYYRADYIKPENIKIGLFIALGMFIGTLFGAKFATQMQSQTLTKMFAVFLVIVAIRLWFTAR